MRQIAVMHVAIVPSRISLCHWPVNTKPVRSIVPKKSNNSHVNNRNAPRVDSLESGSLAFSVNWWNLLLEFISNEVLNSKASAPALKNARKLAERPKVRASLYIHKLERGQHLTTEVPLLRERSGWIKQELLQESSNRISCVRSLQLALLLVKVKRCLGYVECCLLQVQSITNTYRGHVSLYRIIHIFRCAKLIFLHFQWLIDDYCTVKNNLNSPWNQVRNSPFRLCCRRFVKHS